MIFAWGAPMKKLTLWAILVAASAAHAQTPTAPPDRPRLEFEVASIRLSTPTQPGFQAIKLRADGSGYTASYVPVKLMIAFMYQIPARQIVGGPRWLEDDRYDVEAKADKKYTVDDLNTMYENMLADRFHLKFHIETKEANAYVLTIDKNGSKMKVNDQPQSYKIPITFGGIGVMNGLRVPMPYFCWTLGQILQQDERPVVDLSGLSGFYDFTLSYRPPGLSQEARDNLSQEALDRPSLFDALREQLGLRLTAQKGPVQYFVIDHVERPTAN
jgi:uncharacterized protein (TIGR03435 family)